MRSSRLCGAILRRCRLQLSASISTTPSYRSQDNTDLKWLWKLNESQKDYHNAHLSGTRIGTYIITLNTAKPLSASDFRQAIGHLQRKVPHLRTCIRARGDSLWFCQPADIKPSFQVMKDVSNIREIIDDVLRNYMQNPETTWQTRVVFQKNESVCPIPEVKETHPHQYTFLYAAHHALMDGLGFAHVMKCLMEILLNIMKGETIDDEQCVSFSEEKEVPALLGHFRQRLTEDAEFSKDVRDTYPPPDFVPLIFEAYPRPKPSVTTTKFLTGIIEPESLNYLKQRCKREGVTLNSFLLAVINIAVMELARKNGVVKHSYEISPYTVTTFRRYKKESSEFLLGPYSGALSFASFVDVNKKKNFWHYCKTINREILLHIKAGLPLQQFALRMLINKQQSYDYTSNFRPILYDYGLANMGDLTNLMPKNDLIELTEIRSMLFTHHFYASSFHEVVSYNDRLYYTLGYPTNCLSDETAQLFLDEIFSIFEDVKD